MRLYYRIKIYDVGSEEMAQRLAAHTALAEDASSVPITHTRHPPTVL